MEAITSNIIKKIIETKRTHVNITDICKRPNEIEPILQQLSFGRHGLDYLTSIDEFLNSQNKNEMQFFSFFEKKIPLTDSMNPHFIPYPLAEYYVDENENGEKLKHIKELDSLLEVSKYVDGSDKINLVSKNLLHHGILIIGEKGSGKTFSQNIWLHSKNPILELNKIVWIRLDASKLYDIWEGQDLLNKNLTSVKEYFYGQLVYVFAKHFISGFPLHSPLFGEIAQKLSISSINNIPKSLIETKRESRESISPYDIFTFSAQKKNWNTIIDCLKSLEDQIAKYEHLNTGDTRKPEKEREHNRLSFLIDKVLVDSQNYPTDRYKGSKNDWMVVAEILKYFILDNQYYLLFVVDGLDNINFHNKESENLLKKMFNELYEFPLRKDLSHPNELVLFSLRDTTLQSLLKWKEKRYDDRNKYRDINSFYVIRQDSCKLQKPVFEKRIDFVLEKYKGPDCFMKSVIKEMKIDHVIPEESRWNSNIRCFLHNHITLAKLITFRYYFAGKPSDFNIQHQIKNFEELNYILNGRLFLNEKVNFPISNDGFNFFNMFGYLDGNKTPKYLIYLRILQIIFNNPGIRKPELKTIQEIFDYSSLDCEYCLTRLIKSGMIRSDFAIEITNKGDGFFSITEKGKYFLVKFVSDVQYLYYTCIDTKLPLHIIDKLKFHNNNYTVESQLRRNYQPYCLITGLEFLKFLIIANKMELKIVNENKKTPTGFTNRYKLPIDSNSLRESVFKLVKESFYEPEYKKIIKSHFKIE